MQGKERSIHGAVHQLNPQMQPCDVLWLCRQAVDEHLKETQAQYQTLERKYSKAKRLVKEYQQK